ncbi:MAG: phage tail protein [Bacillota bacterium]
MRSRRGIAVALILSVMMLAASWAEARTPITVNEEGLPLASLQVDGAVLDGVTLVEGLGVERPLEEAYCADDGICTGALRLAIDDLDAAADSLTDKARHDTAKNAIGNVRARVAELDQILGINDPDDDGDGLLDRVWAPGQPHFGNITFERKLDGSKELHQWWLDASRGKNIRKSISLIYLDRAGNEVARYNLFECFPVAWSVSLGDSGLVERLEVRVNRIEMARVAGSDPGQGPRGSYSVRLEAGGEVMGSFDLDSSLSGALTWGGGVDDDCDGACTAEAVAALDELAEQVGALGDRARHDIAMNAIRNMKARLAEVETLLAGAYRPGRVKYANITLKRGLNGDERLVGWITDTVSGKPWKRSMLLTVFGPDGKEVAAFAMQGGPVSYTSGGDALAIERIELAVEKIERAK